MPYSTPAHRRRLFTILATGLVLAGGGGSLFALAKATDDTVGGDGQVVEGPSNIRQFRPVEERGEFDAATVNLGSVFEELGADAARWYLHVQTLANPFFEGRAPGTDGIERAASYIEFYFRQAGLEPAFPRASGDNDDPWVSYRQPFDLELRGKPVTVELAEALIGDRPMDRGKDFVALGVSGSGEATASVTFVGYGIEDGPDGYSSFDKDTDLTGRIAILLRHEPLADDGFSQWSERGFSRHAGLLAKLQTVADRGAAGIIVVTPSGAGGADNGLMPLERSTIGSSLRIPVVQMTPKAINRVLYKVDRRKRMLRELTDLANNGEATTIDMSGRSQVTLRTKIRRAARPTANIGGVLRGSGRLADEWLVIGAHYDHVGYGYTGARRNNKGQVHPGADDNASGTAALLVLADRLKRRYAADRRTDRRSILFIAFSAEEAGLVGSRHYVEHATVDPDDMFAMVNMDMVGRLRSGELSISGTGTAEEFNELLTPHVRASGLTVAFTPSGMGPSDHANFARAEVPVLFMFTGLHDAYHTPADQAHTVNPRGAVRVIDLADSIVEDLAKRKESLTFISK